MNAKMNKKAISMRIEKELFDRLNRFCLDAGQSKTTAMERALIMYINHYYENNSKSQ